MIRGCASLVSPEVLFFVFFQVLLLCSCRGKLEKTIENNASISTNKFSNKPFSSANQFPPLYGRLNSSFVDIKSKMLPTPIPPPTTTTLPEPPQQPVCSRISFPLALASMVAQSRRDTSRCVQSNTVIQETLDLPQINYASKDCLAKVVLANEEAVNINAILDDRNNDYYLRNPCEKAQDKFLVIRLCDKIKPTLLEIANFEFFSSGPKNIRLSVSKTFPAAEWLFVKELEVQNTRDVQRFPISFEFDTFVKFVKLEILSHYGTEYYCTLSFVRVYGLPSPVEQEEKSNGNVHNNNNGIAAAASDEKAIVPQRQKNNQNISHSNTAAIFMEFGKRLTALETNFNQYNQVVQSIRLLRNETRYLKQETSNLRRYVFGLQRDRDALRRITHRVKVENRRLRHELKALKDGARNGSYLLPAKNEL